MTEANAVIPIGTNSIPFSLTEFEPGITRRVRRQPFIAQLVNVSRTVLEYIAWAEQTNIDPGVAGNTAEGAAKTVGSFRITEKNSMIETMTYYIKISKRMLDDLALIENEIRTELMEVLALRLDAQTLNGNGTSPQMKGILQYATPFSAGSPLAGTVANVSFYDCLAAAILQVRAGGTTLNGEVYDIFNPNYIVLHPADATIMGLTKDSLGRYIMPPFMSPDGKAIEGLPIVENVIMTQGTYLVGDFTKSNLRIREDANIAIGYENDDFTKNLVTILGEQRAGHYVKSNHTKAFVADTFANTKTIIGTV
jgi:HK97 family phage major capsid protein